MSSPATSIGQLSIDAVADTRPAVSGLEDLQLKYTSLREALAEPLGGRIELTGLDTAIEKVDALKAKLKESFAAIEVTPVLSPTGKTAFTTAVRTLLTELTKESLIGVKVGLEGTAAIKTELETALQGVRGSLVNVTAELTPLTVRQATDWVVAAQRELKASAKSSTLSVPVHLRTSGFTKDLAGITTALDALVAGHGTTGIVVPLSLKSGTTGKNLTTIQASLDKIATHGKTGIDIAINTLMTGTTPAELADFQKQLDALRRRKQTTIDITVTGGGAAGVAALTPMADLLHTMALDAVKIRTMIPATVAAAKAASGGSGSGGSGGGRVTPHVPLGKAGSLALPGYPVHSVPGYTGIGASILGGIGLLKAGEYQSSIITALQGKNSQSDAATQQFSDLGLNLMRMGITNQTQITGGFHDIVSSMAAKYTVPQMLAFTRAVALSSWAQDQGATFQQTAATDAAAFHEYNLSFPKRKKGESESAYTKDLDTASIKFVNMIHVFGQLANSPNTATLMKGMAQANALAATLGMDFKQIAAMQAALTQGSLNPSKAGTQVLNILSHAMHPSAVAKTSMANYQAMLGVSLEGMFNAKYLSTAGPGPVGMINNLSSQLRSPAVQDRVKNLLSPGFSGMSLPSVDPRKTINLVVRNGDFYEATTTAPLPRSRTGRGLYGSSSVGQPTTTYKELMTRSDLESLLGPNGALSLFLSVFSATRGGVGAISLGKARNQDMNTFLSALIAVQQGKAFHSPALSIPANPAFTSLAKQNATIAGQTKQALGGLEVASIEIGTALAPLFATIIKTLNPMVKDVADWVKHNQMPTTVAIVSALSLAVAGPALKVIGTAVTLALAPFKLLARILHVPTLGGGGGLGGKLTTTITADIVNIYAKSVHGGGGLPGAGAGSGAGAAGATAASTGLLSRVGSASVGLARGGGASLVLWGMVNAIQGADVPNLLRHASGSNLLHNLQNNKASILGSTAGLVGNGMGSMTDSLVSMLHGGLGSVGLDYNNKQAPGWLRNLYGFQGATTGFGLPGGATPALPPHAAVHGVVTPAWLTAPVNSMVKGDPKTQAASAGAEIHAGLTQGANMAKAALDQARAYIQAWRTHLGIASPSTVFITIGQQIKEGLQIGLGNDSLGLAGGFAGSLASHLPSLGKLGSAFGALTFGLSQGALGGQLAGIKVGFDTMGESMNQERDEILKWVTIYVPEFVRALRILADALKIRPDVSGIKNLKNELKSIPLGLKIDLQFHTDTTNTLINHIKTITDPGVAGSQLPKLVITYDFSNLAKAQTELKTRMALLAKLLWLPKLLLTYDFSALVRADNEVKLGIKRIEHDLKIRDLLIHARFENPSTLLEIALLKTDIALVERMIGQVIIPVHYGTPGAPPKGGSAGGGEGTGGSGGGGFTLFGGGINIGGSIGIGIRGGNTTTTTGGGGITPVNIKESIALKFDPTTLVKVQFDATTLTKLQLDPSIKVAVTFDPTTTIRLDPRTTIKLDPTTTIKIDPNTVVQVKMTDLIRNSIKVRLDPTTLVSTKLRVMLDPSLIVSNRLAVTLDPKLVVNNRLAVDLDPKFSSHNAIRIFLDPTTIVGVRIVDATKIRLDLTDITKIGVMTGGGAGGQSELDKWLQRISEISNILMGLRTLFGGKAFTSVLGGLEGVGMGGVMAVIERLIPVLGALAAVKFVWDATGAVKNAQGLLASIQFFGKTLSAKIGAELSDGLAQAKKLPNVVTAVGDLGKSLITGFLGGVNDKEKGLKTNIQGITTSVIRWIGHTDQVLWQKGSDLILGALNGLNEKLNGKNGLMGKVQSITSQVKGWLGTPITVLYQAGKDLIQGLINGIENMIPSLWGVLGDIGNKIPIHKGPPEVDARLLFNNGSLIIKGLIAGMQSQRGAIQTELTGITNTLSGIGAPTSLLRSSSFSPPPPTTSVGGPAYYATPQSPTQGSGAGATIQVLLDSKVLAQSVLATMVEGQYYRVGLLA